MNNESLIKIAEAWFAAFNSHDLERLLLLYDDHAQHYSPKLKLRRPETNGLIEGKQALRDWWEDSFERIPSLQYEIIRLSPFQDRIFMEYLRKAEGDKDLIVGETLDVRAGLIVFSRVYHS